ncbi:MAG: alpha/beta hydrolase [Candidatus Obscuribacter sp.]|nr:alpha/beta hydrolase [Candidatus Obscuribacter sp.]
MLNIMQAACAPPSLAVQMSRTGLAYRFEERVGSTKPPIVMLHGLASSMELEDQLAFPDWKPLARKHSLLRFDCRGHGQSRQEVDGDKYTWSVLGHDICQLAKELNLEEVTLAGSSMGAAASLYAALLANSYGLKIKALILMLPPTYGETRKTQAHLYRKYQRIIKTQGTAALIQLWRRSAPTPFFAREFPEAREINFAFFAKQDAESMAAAFLGAADSDFPEATFLQQLKMPTLILSRSDDPAHPIESAHHLKEAITGSHHQHASNASEIRNWSEDISSFLANC